MSAFDELSKLFKPPGECCDDCQRVVASAVAELHAQHGVKPNAPRQNTRVNDHEVSLDVPGRRGDVTFVSVELDRVFRILKKLAIDTRDGKGVRVLDFTVNGESALRGLHFLSREFSDGPLGCGIAYPNVQPGAAIGLALEFLADCTFHAAFFGKAIP